jgi:hypothetical protein
MTSESISPIREPSQSDTPTRSEEDFPPATEVGKEFQHQEEMRQSRLSRGQLALGGASALVGILAVVTVGMAIVGGVVLLSNPIGWGVLVGLGALAFIAGAAGAGFIAAYGEEKAKEIMKTIGVGLLCGIVSAIATPMAGIMLYNRLSKNPAESSFSVDELKKKPEGYDDFVSQHQTIKGYSDALSLVKEHKYDEARTILWALHKGGAKNKALAGDIALLAQKSSDAKERRCAAYLYYVSRLDERQKLGPFGDKVPVDTEEFYMLKQLLRKYTGNS